MSADNTCFIPAYPDSEQQPMQPVVVDEHGTLRFKKNSIVAFLANGRLNELASMNFPNADWEQLAQLIGYSVGGFEDLSYASDAVCDQARDAARDLLLRGKV